MAVSAPALLDVPLGIKLRSARKLLLRRVMLTRLVDLESLELRLRSCVGSGHAQVILLPIHSL